MLDGINFGSSTKGRRIAAKKFAAKQANINVSFMALRSCNVLLQNRLRKAQVHYIEKRTNQATRFFTAIHPTSSMSLMKIWLKLPRSGQMFH